MSAKILAIDPGSEKTAWVIYDSDGHKVVGMAKADNKTVLEDLPALAVKTGTMVIEYPRPRGQMMTTQLVDTIFWIGRFFEAVATTFIDEDKIFMMDRKDVKMTLCGFATAKDSNIRAAILSLFPPTGGGSVPEIGIKKKPGPLYGVSADVWAALGVALTWADPTYHQTRKKKLSMTV